MAEPETDRLFDSEPGSQPNSEIERLFREHNVSLVRYLRGRLNSDADAREAAQEAYVRLLQLDHPEKLSFLRAYLFKIAANVATDLLRRRAVRRHVQEDQAQIFVLATQEQTLEAYEQLQTVDRALDQISPRCREAFLLSRHEGWGTARIAEHLGVSTRMVRLYLERTIEHIEAALAEKDGKAGKP